MVAYSFRPRFGDVILGCAAMENFAQADGFSADGRVAVLDMAAFWFDAHGRGVDEIDFHGVVIAWRSITSFEESCPCG